MPASVSPEDKISNRARTSSAGSVQLPGSSPSTSRYVAKSPRDSIGIKKKPTAPVPQTQEVDAATLSFSLESIAGIILCSLMILCLSAFFIYRLSIILRRTSPLAPFASPIDADVIAVKGLAVSGVREGLKDVASNLFDKLGIATQLGLGTTPAQATSQGETTYPTKFPYPLAIRGETVYPTAPPDLGRNLLKDASHPSYSDGKPSKDGTVERVAVVSDSKIQIDTEIDAVDGSDRALADGSKTKALDDGVSNTVLVPGPRRRYLALQVIQKPFKVINSAAEMLKASLASLREVLGRRVRKPHFEDLIDKDVLLGILSLALGLVAVV